MNLASGAGDLIFQSIYNQMDFSKINLVQTAAASTLGALPAAVLGNTFEFNYAKPKFKIQDNISIKSIVFSTAANFIGGRNQNTINSVFRHQVGANELLQTTNFLLLNAGGQVATEASK